MEEIGTDRAATGFLRTRLTRAGAVAAIVAAIGMPTLAAHAHLGHDGENSLLDLGLEDLLQLNVTSVSKKAQHFFVTPAAVYVITQEDIRRMGVTSVPEALRSVPGIEVARIDADKWAVTSRGFNSRYASKLLVMVDGRSLYSPSFSGVLWESLDLYMSDIDRIEVIRGPGGAIWGANAVNGVVNIITRDASASAGTEGMATVGSLERASFAARYGSEYGDDTHYRVYGKASRTVGLPDTPEGEPHPWTAGQFGFRMDGARDNGDDFSVQGSFSRGEVQDSYVARTSFWPPVMVQGSTLVSWTEYNVLGSYRRTFSNRSSLVIQSFYQDWSHDWTIDDTRRMFDLDVQHHFAWGNRHDVVWGTGYRVARENIVAEPTYIARFESESQTSGIANVFVQDEITLWPSLQFTLGTKAEYNDYTGLEWQPTGRLLYAPQSDFAAWAAVSRAVHTPDWSDREIRADVMVIPGSGETPTLIAVLGNPDLDAESVIAYELGMRFKAGQQGLLDVATFFNDYDRLFALTPVAPFTEDDPSPTHLVVANRYTNGGGGTGYGAEAMARWDVSAAWRVFAGYSWLRLELETDPGAVEASLKDIEGRSPRHHASVRSQLDLGRHLEWDVSGHRVSGLASFDVPAYTRIDTRVGWRLSSREELSVGVENVFDAEHHEFGDHDLVIATAVERSVWVRLSFGL